jgi:murein DD-endopeptidase MepM/ murein hydrolase activator NlpD
MIILPKISDKVVVRPGVHDFEVPYFIPDNKNYEAFWGHIYRELQELNFYSPVRDDIDQYINTDVGFFGLRTHPAGKKEPYYHIGVEMRFDDPFEVTPIASSVLEYSGYGAINGYYVLLSHPQIQTEDGYILHSMYCHLKKPQVSFSSYQKMLREISLGSYPIIPVKSQEILGTTGSSGVVKGDEPKLYLQLDFRKYGETPIALDPLPIFTGDVRENASARKIDFDD